MKSGQVSTMDSSPIAAPVAVSRNRPGLLWYRFGLILAGIVWVGISCSLCGCGTMNGYVMNRSGKRYFEKGNYEFARYEFERALMDDPHNANYAFNVARTMELEGEYENAEAMYQHALTIDPNHLPSYHGLASMLREQGRQAEARELLVAWADTQPYSAEAQMSAAQLHQQEGNPHAARTHYQQALRDMPPSRKQQKLMSAYHPESQMAMYGAAPGRSARYPYHTPPSMQMAHVMPQSDPTMMGGPVVAHRPVMTSPQLPATEGPIWTPTPQHEALPTIPQGNPQLLPELPMPTSQAPQAYQPQQYATAPVQPNSPLTAQPRPWQQIPAPYAGSQPAPQYTSPPVTGMRTQQEFPVAPGNPSPYGTGSPYQNVSTQSTTVVPAVQPF